MALCFFPSCRISKKRPFPDSFKRVSVLISRLSCMIPIPTILASASFLHNTHSTFLNSGFFSNFGDRNTGNNIRCFIPELRGRISKRVFPEKRTAPPIIRDKGKGRDISSLPTQHPISSGGDTKVPERLRSQRRSGLEQEARLSTAGFSGGITCE